MGSLKYDSDFDGMKNWIIEETCFDANHLGKCEAIFTQGNGYMGVRAALEESYVGEARGMFVNGTFDAFDGKEVTELPNLPDVTNINLYINNERFSLDSGNIKAYCRRLNLITGELTRTVTWESPLGNVVELTFERIVSLKEKHLIAQQIKIVPVSGNVSLQIESGINSRITNSGTQHFSEGEKRFFEGKFMQTFQTSIESGVAVAVTSAQKFILDAQEQKISGLPVIDRRRQYCKVHVDVKAGATFIMEKVSSVFTSRDIEFCEAADLHTLIKKNGLSTVRNSLREGYEHLRTENALAWKAVWENNDIILRTDNDFDQLAIRFAVYHLTIMYSGDDARLGIGAKALSGEGYKGHSFWDTEIFILPYYLMTQPKKAKNLLRYRYLCRNGARDKAAESGFTGLMYPWESAWIDDGEVTPCWGDADIVTGTSTKILTGIIEQHISADIAYAIEQYFRVTGDQKFMNECGYEIIFGTAEFWTGRVEWNAGKSRYEIRDVIGPDEYKEHVDNNAYTNYMVHHNLILALNAAEKLQQSDPELYGAIYDRCHFQYFPEKTKTVASKLYLPAPTGEDLLIPQDDTYLSKREIELNRYKNCEKVGTIYHDYNMEQINDLQVSKQADVVLLIYLLDSLFDEKTKRNNYTYYEAHTLHDSSLSMAMHSLIAGKLGLDSEAVEFFRDACRIDFGEKMHSSDAGIHAASMGGIWQTVVFGFGGVQVSENGLNISPKLSKAWSELAFRIVWHEEKLQIVITPQELSIKNEGEKTVSLSVFGKGISIEAQSEFVQRVPS